MTQRKEKMCETLQVGLFNKVYVTQEIIENENTITIKKPTEASVQINFLENLITVYSRSKNNASFYVL